MPTPCSLPLPPSRCCCSGAACPGSGGCNGGYPLEAWEFFKSKGVVTGGLYQARDDGGGRRRRRRGRGHQTPLPGPAALLLPQEDPTPACKKTCIPGYATPFASDEKKAKTAYNVPSNVAQIQAEIQARGPVTAAFTVYQVSGSAPRGSPPRSQPPRCPCHRRTS